MERTPGPRDWMPPETADDGYASRSHTRTRASTPYAASWDLDGYTPTRRRSARGLGWISLLFGTAALVMAMLNAVWQHEQGGLVVSGVGVTAVAFGVAALRARANERLVARTGIVFGVLGVAGMAWSVVALMIASGGIVLPTVPFVDRVEDSEQAIADAEYVLEDAPQALPVTEGSSTGGFATAEDEWNTLAQTAGTVAYTLVPGPDGLWPSALAVTTDGSALLAPDGSILVALPLDVSVDYSVSADRTAYVLTLGSAHFGTVAAYDSASNVVSLSQ